MVSSGLPSYSASIGGGPLSSGLGLEQIVPDSIGPQKTNSQGVSSADCAEESLGLAFSKAQEEKRLEVKRGKRVCKEKNSLVVREYSLSENSKVKKSNNTEKESTVEGNRIKIVAEVGRRASRVAFVYKLYPGFNQFNRLWQKPKSKKGVGSDYTGECGEGALEKRPKKKKGVPMK